MRLFQSRKKAARKEGEKLFAKPKQRWPMLSAEITPEGWERGDAYIWITVPEDLEDEVSLAAIELQLEVYDRTGLELEPRTLLLKTGAPP